MTSNERRALRTLLLRKQATVREFTDKQCAAPDSPRAAIYEKIAHDANIELRAIYEVARTLGIQWPYEVPE